MIFKDVTNVADFDLKGERLYYFRDLSCFKYGKTPPVMCAACKAFEDSMILDPFDIRVVQSDLSYEYPNRLITIGLFKLNGFKSLHSGQNVANTSK